MALTTITTAGITAAAVTEPKLATTGTASSTTFLRGDMSWQVNAGGDVVGPGSSTNDALVRFDTTTGKLLQNSTATLSDAGTLTATAFAGPIAGAVTGNVTGNIDGIVGGTTPAAGTFTTFTSSGIDDNADAVAITIDSSERVGINQATPAHVLDVLVGTGSEAGINVKSSGASGNTSRLVSNAGDDGQLELLQSTGTSIVKLVGDATTENYVKATLNMYDNVVQRAEMKDYSETKVVLSAAATVDIDLATGNVFTLTPDQNTTFTFSNPAVSGKSCSFTLIWTQDSTDRTITWPGTVDWAGGSAPDVTSGSGKRDVYTFFSMDAGTIWYGFQAGADMS